jgi:hypothetical protein
MGTEVITCPNLACQARIAVFVEEELNECEHCGTEMFDFQYEQEGITFSYRLPQKQDPIGPIRLPEDDGTPDYLGGDELSKDCGPNRCP